MKKKITANPLFAEIKSIIEDAKSLIVRNVNTVIVYSYFQIGKRIIEH